MEGTGHLCRVCRVVANPSRPGRVRRRGLASGQRRGLERADPRPAAPAPGRTLPGALVETSELRIRSAFRSSSSGLADLAGLPVYPLGRRDGLFGSARRLLWRPVFALPQPPSRAPPPPSLPLPPAPPLPPPHP